ncbi:PREDICTED: proline-rich proteoglycan 2-like [Rhinopithecus bieti]|uniref:proline-rich proteoglycan 2-like n=1 Tax=Rhinopithecus bieti TaxID=61621 RepID=UPI00083C14D8|nr:PREDICTED: proline-rich proteoglycan 2-like [Rhinopithecus bieti]
MDVGAPPTASPSQRPVRGPGGTSWSSRDNPPLAGLASSAPRPAAARSHRPQRASLASASAAPLPPGRAPLPSPAPSQASPPPPPPRPTTRECGEAERSPPPPAPGHCARGRGPGSYSGGISCENVAVEEKNIPPSCDG